MDRPDAIELDVAETPGHRIGIAWRELRRLAGAQAIRREIYGPAAPLEQGQGDALEYVVKHGPCRMSELARFMRVDPSSATRAVERLEKAGYVARTSDPNDARAVQVAASTKGVRLYHEGRGRALALLDTALRSFTDQERSELATLMERLVDAIDDFSADEMKERS